MEYEYLQRLRHEPVDLPEREKTKELIQSLRNILL